MNQVIETLRTLSGLQPPALPALDIPQMPKYSTLRPLSKAMGADPQDVTRIESAIEGLGRDRGIISSSTDQANSLIACASQDLIHIGLKFLSVSLSLLPALIHPSSAATATARLNAFASLAIQAGHQRLSFLQTELEPISQQLNQVSNEEDPTPQPPPPPSPPPEEHPAPAPSEEPDPAPESEPPPPSEEYDSSPGQAAVNAALSQLGTPYLWGGTGEGGFDCSGLVQWAYAQAGIELPRLAEEQAVGKQVDASELQPGDLAVWSGHVAMYIGDGMMVEAGDPVQTNPVRTSNMGMAFKGFWRPTG